MFNAAAINNLQDEKALLVAESDINRLTLQADFSMLQASVAKAQQTVKIGVGIYPMVMAVGSVLGFLFLKKKKLSIPSSLVGKAIGAWGIFQRVKPFLAAIRGGSSREKISAP